MRFTLLLVAVLGWPIQSFSSLDGCVQRTFEEVSRKTTVLLTHTEQMGIRELSKVMPKVASAFDPIFLNGTVELKLQMKVARVDPRDWVKALDPMLSETERVAAATRLLNEMNRTGAITLDDFYRQVYRTYENSPQIQNEIVALVKNVENSLPKSRQRHLFVVRSSNQVAATLRIFNGTASLNADHATLPFAKAMEVRGIRSRVAEELASEARQGVAQTPIFELGKFVIDDALDAGSRNQVRESLHELLREFCRQNPGARVYVHVASRAHQKLYERAYGLKVVEHITTSGGEEWIMKINTDELLRNLIRD